jgi:histidinol phosphatase-like PHP family hydrolase
VINADAHKAKDLDGYYDEAQKTLLSAGYTESLIFKGRKDGKAVWDSEKL